MIEEEGEEGDRKGKGKRKETAGRPAPNTPAPAHYTKIENAGRCGRCQQARVLCEVNVTALARWREGRTETKVVCWRCKTKKVGCVFGKEGAPKARTKGKAKATALREESVTPSAASSRKRKREEMVAVEMPPPKTRVVVAPRADEALLAVLGRIDGRLEELGGATREVAKELRAATEQQAARDRVLVSLLACLTRERAPSEVAELVRKSAAVSEEPVASGSGSSSVATSSTSSEGSEEKVLEVPIEDVREEEGKAGGESDAEEAG